MRTAQPAIYAMIFDVDGTLVTDEQHLHKHNHVLRDRLQLPQLAIGEAAWQAIGGLSDKVAYDYINAQATEKGVAGKLPSADAYIAMTDDYFFAHMHEMKMREGAASLLAAAQQRQLPMGLATNAMRHETQTKLKFAGLSDTFRFMSCLDDVRNPKPAPDIYQNAVGKMRGFTSPRLQPRQVLVVEDTKAGATAALAAGCRTVWWKPPHMQGELSHPNLTVTSDSREIVHMIHQLATPGMNGMRAAPEVSG